MLERLVSSTGGKPRRHRNLREALNVAGIGWARQERLVLETIQTELHAICRQRGQRGAERAEHVEPKILRLFCQEQHAAVEATTGPAEGERRLTLDGLAASQLFPESLDGRVGRGKLNPRLALTTEQSGEDRELRDVPELHQRPDRPSKRSRSSVGTSTRSGRTPMP
jgi:hypothetical protein